MRIYNMYTGTLQYLFIRFYVGEAAAERDKVVVNNKNEDQVEWNNNLALKGPEKKSGLKGHLKQLYQNECRC